MISKLLGLVHGMGLRPVSRQDLAVCESNQNTGNSRSPVEHFLSSVYAVKGALSPAGLESAIRGAAKDLELNFLMPKRKAHRKEKKMDGFKVNSKTSDLSKDSFCCAEESKKASFLKFPLKLVWGNVFHNAGKSRKTESKQNDLSQSDDDISQAQNPLVDEEKPCTNCLLTVVTQTLLLGNFLQTIPNHFRSVKKCFGRHSCDTASAEFGEAEFAEKTCSQSTFQLLPNEFSFKNAMLHTRGSFPVNGEKLNSTKKAEGLPFELFLNVLLEYCLQSHQKLEQKHAKINEQTNHTGIDVRTEAEQSSAINKCQKFFLLPDFKDMGFLQTIFKGDTRDDNSFLANLKFARMGGTPDLLRDSPAKEDSRGQVITTNEAESNPAQKLTTEIFNLSVTNVEKVRSILSAVSLPELMELVPQIGRSSHDYPDKKKLFSVQDFFRYTQSEGRRFFDELDRDGDGQVTLEDLEVAVRKRRLPRRYAREFLRRTRTHMFAKSIGWKQFLSLMEQKEPTMLRAYNTLSLSKSGTLQKSQVLASLKNAGLPATDENVAAMMRFLDADTEGSISYGHFRNFMLLLPPERLEDDPRSLWFEAATVVAVAPPVVIPAGSVLKSALAGGLSCALSTSLMHPLDTMKTRVQASTLSFPELISKLPQIGYRGLYRGSIPAIIGQFSSHGLRTGFFEASKMLLTHMAPTLPEIQVQSLASLIGTVLGTASRIPCEVLKQRLQAGIFDNVGAAIIGTWEQDGLKGFFRGTGATLCREVPFYVAGMGLYAEAKKVAQQLVNRELEPWETLAVGALSGGLAAVVTTPFDVMKTRMMTAPPGVPTTMTAIAFTILKQDGPLGLFKGAVPRFFWIAPLGAMNFAGYELARKAMDRADDNVDELSQEKRLVKAG